MHTLLWRDRRSYTDASADPLQPLLFRVGTGDGADRSAVSMCWCVLETVLSTIVFLYVMKGAGETIKDMRSGGLDFRELCNLSVGSIFGSLLLLFLPLNALVCTGCALCCAVWTGVSHSLCLSRVRAAVDDIDSAAGGGGINRPGGRCSVNLFEYHDVVTMGLRISKAVSVWVLFQVFFIMPVVGIVAHWMSYSSDNWSVLHVLKLVWMALYFVFFVFFLCAIAVIIVKSGEEYRTRPFHFHARVLLLTSAMVFAVLLYFSPAPSTWRWTLIAIHAIRVSNVLTSLFSQFGVVDGMIARGGDML